MEDYDDGDITNKTIIIDNGTCYCKAGFGGKDEPEIVIPTTVGYPLKQINPYFKKDFYIGNEGKGFRSTLKLSNPIQRGIVENWDDMEKIWEHIFKNELKIDPDEYNIIITEVIMNPKENKEKITQIIFEDFNVEGLIIINPAILDIYSGGKYSGIVIDSGDGVTQIVPIFDGYSLPHASNCVNFAGSDLTEYMIRLLNEVGGYYSSSYQKEIVRGIKEKLCYTAFEFDKELNYCEPSDCILPDGKEVYIKDQRIRCPEAFFNPLLIGKEIESLPKLCFNSIQKVDIDARVEIYKNIILAGGSTSFKGFEERFDKEIKILCEKEMKKMEVDVNVIGLPEKIKGAWIGGSVVSCLTTFKNCFITKTEYEESGATIVHRKFYW